MAYTLTDDTIDLLKNIASINSEFIFKAGTAQRACNPSRNFIADIEFTDPFPKECAIADLPRILSVVDISMGDARPTLEFGDSSLVVRHAHGKVTVPYAHEAVIKKPPTHQYHLADPVATFDLPAGLWRQIKRTAATLQTPTLHLAVKDGKLEFKLVHEKNLAGASAAYRMPNTTITNPAEGVWGVTLESLELFPGDYAVEIGNIGASNLPPGTQIFGAFFHLKSDTHRVTYLSSGHVVKGK